MVFDYLKVDLVVGMTGSVSVNENGDRNEDYAVYDFRLERNSREIRRSWSLLWL